MGSTNAMLTQIIQDAILKLCTQNIIFHKSLEIDGIICISHSEEDKDMVIKMHRTIVKPENSSNNWNDNSLHNIHVQNTPLVYTKSPRITENVQHFEPPQVNLIPIATAEIPGGQVAKAAKLTIKEEASEKFLSKRSTKDNKRLINDTSASVSHSPSKHQRLDIEPSNDLTPSGDDKIINVKREVEDNVTLDFDNDVDGGTEEGPDQPSWLDTAPLKISPTEVASSSAGVTYGNNSIYEGGTFTVFESEVKNERRMPDENVLKTPDQDDSLKSSLNCKICKKEFGYAHVLKVHMRTHTGEKPFVCKYCNKCFKTKQNCETHIRIHTGEKPFQCNICMRLFNQLGSLQRHKELKHMRKNSFPPTMVTPMTPSV